jgi:hypothetical protein
MYVSPNFKTKKALKEAVALGQRVEVFQPNNMFGIETPKEGWVTVEGPHYPKPHTWYGNVLMEAGRITKVK